ncbi:MAG TPA: ABC transporter substrate-binding protein [Stellaceae bacterium]|nr:ABC transporter substrate-binding protein [Stellaceae bacterium]
MTKRLGGPAIGRRTLLKAGAAMGAAATTSAIPLVNVWGASSNTIRIGWIGARSGWLANFNVPDPWIIDKVKKVYAKGLAIGGRNYTLDIVVKDNQSDNNVSATVSNELVLRDRCDLILADNGAAVLSVGPLADARGVPALSSMAPWESFVIGRGKMPGPGYKGFPFSFHIGFGVGDMLTDYLATWNLVTTDKVVGSLWQDDPAGRAFGNDHIGLPAVATKQGYKIVPGGYFQMNTNDFSNQVTKFKNANAELAVAYSSPEQMVVIVNQMAQQKFRPKVLTIAGAPLFPASVEALGDHGDGLTTEVWWTPAWPHFSPITGQTAKELAADWEKDTGKQWTQPLGYTMGLWDAGIAALKSASHPKDKVAIRDAIKDLDTETVTGHIDFKHTHIPSVAQTPMCTGQWVLNKGGRFKYELQVVANKTSPEVPIGVIVKPYAG